jgi:hypothetical protein
LGISSRSESQEIIDFHESAFSVIYYQFFNSKSFKSIEILDLMNAAPELLSRRRVFMSGLFAGDVLVKKSPVVLGKDYMTEQYAMMFRMNLYDLGDVEGEPFGLEAKDAFLHGTPTFLTFTRTTDCLWVDERPTVLYGRTVMSVKNVPCRCLTTNDDLADGLFDALQRVNVGARGRDIRAMMCTYLKVDPRSLGD